MTQLPLTHPKRACCQLVQAIMVVLVASACSRAQTQPQSPTALPQTSAGSHEQLNDGGWARFRSVRFGLSIPFPDGRSWLIDDRRSQWLVASHAESASMLRARTWTEPMLMNQERCEHRAREWTADIPKLDSASVLDRRLLKDVPAPGFDTQVTAAMIESRPSSPAIGAAVLAFGVSMKKCFAMLYVTSAVGAQGAGELGDRLEIATRIVEGTRFQTELAPETRPGPAAP